MAKPGAARAPTWPWGGVQQGSSDFRRRREAGRAVRRAVVVSWKRGGTRMEVAAGLQARWWRQTVVTTAVSEGVVGIFYFF